VGSVGDLRDDSEVRRQHAHSVPQGAVAGPLLGVSRMDRPPPFFLSPLHLGKYSAFRGREICWESKYCQELPRVMMRVSLKHFRFNGFGRTPFKS